MPARSLSRDRIAVRRRTRSRRGRAPGLGLIALDKGYALPCIAVIVWIALVVWLGLVMWSLSVVRAAAGADAPAPTRTRAPVSGVLFAGRRRLMAVSQGVLLVVTLAATVLLSDEAQWTPLPLT